MPEIKVEGPGRQPGHATGIVKGLSLPYHISKACSALHFNKEVSVSAKVCTYAPEPTHQP